MPDRKRIALFLDGTWNTLNDNTNVWRLKSLASVTSDQLCYYSAGVGTQRGERLLGGTFGYGLDQEVIDAYEWLMERYSPDDRIFIFGFSRGAFTARSLSGFISKCGLLKPGSPISLNQLYARYRKGSTVHTIRELANVADAELAFEDKWLKKYSMAIPIWFVGVWDTVGALGIPFGNLAMVSRARYKFLETDLRINNARAYQALAIDEHRQAFAPTLWKKSVQVGVETYAPRPLSDVEQRWFAGAHADVGGGYENGLLAQIPLLWLAEKAVVHGLLLNDLPIIDDDQSEARIHDSFAEMAAGIYRASKLWQPFYREIGAAPHVEGIATATTINETIDESVFDRWRRDVTYRPLNLARWARAHQVDVSTLNHAVRADNPSIEAPWEHLAAESNA